MSLEAPWESLGGRWGSLGFLGASLGGLEASLRVAVSATNRFVMYTNGIIDAFVISLWLRLQLEELLSIGSVKLVMDSVNSI